MVLRSFGYPISVVALLLGVGPVSWTLHRHQNDPEIAAKYRKHLSAPRDGAAVRVLGQAQGTAIKAPSGRSCLAYQYLVQRSAGKSTRTLCSGGAHGELELSGDSMDHPYEIPKTSALPLKLEKNRERMAFRRDIGITCNGATTQDRLLEYCLLPGDDVEVWGCLQVGPEGRSIVNCSDGSNELESPPAGGPLARFQRSASLPLALSMLWLCVWAAVALGILSQSITTTKREKPLSRPEVA